jgi:hypothetical protein
MVGTAKEVIRQQLVVGCAVTVEEINIGLHVGGSERLVTAVTLIKAVQTTTHGIVLALTGTC